MTGKSLHFGATILCSHKKHIGAHKFGHMRQGVVKLKGSILSLKFANTF